MKTGKCKNCGADKRLHKFETLQCPTHGVEARNQEWMNIVFKESQKDKEIDPGNEPKEFFEITSICRQDLKNIGFDASKIDDTTMERLAEELANAYCNKAFWMDLKLVAEELKIPKL